MTKFVARFANDESGATAIEYGLIASGIAVAIIVAVNTIGTSLDTMFDNINTEIQVDPNA
jgi:pilus assembly protein Flp/PilA